MVYLLGIVAFVTVLFANLFLVVQKTAGEKGKLLRTRKVLFVACFSLFFCFMVIAIAIAGQII